MEITKLTADEACALYPKVVEWRAVPWAPRYEVSRDGQVRSWVALRGGHTRPDQIASSPRLLKVGKKGRVCIYTGPSTYKEVTAHLLAREVFGE